MLAELTDVLSRSKFYKKIAASQLSPDELVDAYACLTLLVRPEPVSRLAPDKDDDMVLATAFAAKADFIVTGDQAFLALNTCQKVRLCSVREALAYLD